MVVRTGFEPASPRHLVGSVTNYVHLTMFVIPTGFEPVTYCLEGSCSIQLSYEIVEPAHVIQRMDHPAFIGAYRRTRTANPLITSQVLYQLKLCRHFSRLFD